MQKLNVLSGQQEHLLLGGVLLELRSQLFEHHVPQLRALAFAFVRMQALLLDLLVEVLLRSLADRSRLHRQLLMAALLVVVVLEHFVHLCL